ncbi:unnamed protein product [Effrenium voratum]|nr:unnamed protein product [Effrenium voratum]
MRSQHPHPQPVRPVGDSAAEPEAVRLRKRRRLDEEAALDKPAVCATRWSQSAVMVLAGHQDGGAAACAAAPSSPGVSAVKKTFGKVLGSLGDANLALRNGLVQIAVPGAPADDCVRLLDVLTALAETEVYAGNQLYLERLLHFDQEARKKKDGVSSVPTSSLVEPPDLTDVEFAGRRLVDALAEAGKWDLAAADGLPLRLSRKSEWGNFRQHYFIRRKKDAAQYKQYGYCLRGSQTLEIWKCSTQAQERYGNPDSTPKMRQ